MGRGAKHINMASRAGALPATSTQVWPRSRPPGQLLVMRQVRGEARKPSLQGSQHTVSRHWAGSAGTHPQRPKAMLGSQSTGQVWVGAGGISGGPRPGRGMAVAGGRPALLPCSSGRAWNGAPSSPGRKPGLPEASQGHEDLLMHLAPWHTMELTWWIY